MDKGREVTLFAYDLSGGIAAQFSSMLLGSQIEAIWHTSVVVDGVEYYYGAGIQRGQAGDTPFGQPVEKISLGTTHVPDDVIVDFLFELAASRFGVQHYRLMSNNCNNFSDELVMFLTGAPIPARFTDLPTRVQASPKGALVQPFLQFMETQLSTMKQENDPSPFATPDAGDAAGEHVDATCGAEPGTDNSGAATMSSGTSAALAQAVLSGLSAAYSASQEAAGDAVRPHRGGGNAAEREQPVPSAPPATEDEQWRFTRGGEDAGPGVAEIPIGDVGTGDLSGVVIRVATDLRRGLGSAARQKRRGFPSGEGVMTRAIRVPSENLQEAVDMELAKLLSQGWEFEAAVTMAVQRASEGRQERPVEL